jgi:hypothetical protein
MNLQTGVLIRPALTGLIMFLGLANFGSAMAQETANDLECKRCVGTRDLAKKAIKGKNIRDNTITSSKIADGTISADDIAPGVLEESQNGDDSITSSDIVDGTIIADDLANGAVTSRKIKDGTITTDDLGPGAVGTSELQDEAVNNTKLAPNAVSTPEIEDGAVTASKLSPDAVNARMFVASGAAQIRTKVPIPPSSAIVVLSLDPSGASASTGLIEIPFDGRLMATVSMRLTPTSSPATAQCRLFRRLESAVAVSAMTNYIPRIPVPSGGVATSLVGFSSVTAGTYDVALRCSAGFSGVNPQVTLEEAQLIVWALAI